MVFCNLSRTVVLMDMDCWYLFKEKCSFSTRVTRGDGPTFGRVFRTYYAPWRSQYRARTVRTPSQTMPERWRALLLIIGGAAT